MLTGHNTSNVLNVIAGEAIDPGLRVKWGSTAGQVELAGDEACIGVSSSRAYAAGERMTVIDIKATGTLPFTAGGAIAAGAGFTSAAGGKVVTGSGGVQDYGVAMDAASGDGSQFAGTSGI